MSATEWTVISESDLDDERESGGFIRCRCHIHGGDHQRSLSINADTGFGTCHQCGARVLVKEINQEAATNIESALARIAAGEIKVRDPKYIKLAPKQPKPRAIERWQQEEIDLLRSLQHNMESRLGDERVRAYIEGRGLKLETAAAAGLGYIPDMALTGKYKPLAKWADHIIISVYSPSDGLQFVGRCLRHWQPGMDENAHKSILDEKDIDRWRKTYAGGWFNLSVLETASRVTFCEGAFDALALIEAGMQDAIAIIGTTIDASWLPKNLQHITLAFDGDEKGREKSAKARDTLYIKGYDVTICGPPADNQGKDWSERYRLHGAAGLAILIDRREEDDLHCWCGAEVEYYSAEGMPYCGEHLLAEPETPAPFGPEDARNLVEEAFGHCEMQVFRPGELTHKQRIADLGLKTVSLGVHYSALERD